MSEQYVSMDVSDWELWNKEVLYFVQNTMPKETKKFMRREAGRAATTARKKARSTVKKKTGNYFKSIKNSKAWRNSKGGYGAKVYAKKPLGAHAHLLEYGHNVVIKGKKIGKKTKDFHIIQRGVKSFEGRFYTDCIAFVNEHVRNGIRGK